MLEVKTEGYEVEFVFYGRNSDRQARALANLLYRSLPRSSGTTEKSEGLTFRVSIENSAAPAEKAPAPIDEK